MQSAMHHTFSKLTYVKQSYSDLSGCLCGSYVYMLILRKSYFLSETILIVLYHMYYFKSNTY